MGGSLPIHIVMFAYSIIELEYIKEFVYKGKEFRMSYECVNNEKDFNPLYKDIYVMILAHAASIIFIVLALLMELKSYLAKFHYTKVILKIGHISTYIFGILYI